MQVPTPTNETVVPETVQTPALELAAEIETGKPELAAAAMLYVAPMTAPPGAVELKWIDWMLKEGAPPPTANDCCTCGAAW